MPDPVRARSMPRRPIMRRSESGVKQPEQGLDLIWLRCVEKRLFPLGEQAWQGVSRDQNDLDGRVEFLDLFGQLHT
ncbi:conserved hypothetical protein, partial [Ricinus communis]